jgi:hypothetical protein
MSAQIIEPTEPAIEFLRRNNIRFMPIILNGKIPCAVGRCRHYMRQKKDGSGVTYVPSACEFKTIDNEVLEKRIAQIENYEFNALGIDTNETYQIDVDTDQIDPELIAYMTANFPYYKSMTKYYGYHFFIRVKGFPPSGLVQFVNMFEGVDRGHVEMLCGNWGYFKAGTTIVNADKPIPTLTCSEDYTLGDCDGLPPLKLNYKPKPKRREHVDRAPHIPLPSAPAHLPNPVDEIRDHVANIDAAKYLSVHQHHFKICCVLFKYGYRDIAYSTVDRVVNPKHDRSKLIDILSKWERAPNDKLTIGTLFHYSKLSNYAAFTALLAKWRGMRVPERYRTDLFELKTVNRTINERYLPSDLLIKKITDDASHQIIHIKSHLGTGKTTVMRNYIRANPTKKILYFAPRVAFANDIHASLPGFEIYTDIKRKGTAFNYDRVIIQAESLHRVATHKYDILVIDEIESVLKQLTSKETNKQMTKTYETFDRLIKATPKIISLDAFLTEHSISTIRDVKNRRALTEVIVNDHQPYSRTATELKDLETLIEAAKEQLKRGERIVFITMSKTDGDTVKESLSTVTDKIGYYYGSMSQKDKKFDNVEKDWGELDVLMYTPIITCGVNFDPPTPHFHTLYIWAIPNSCVVRDLAQASLRVRKLINNDCFFAVSRRNYSYTFKKFDVDDLGVENCRQNVIYQQEAVQKLGFAHQSLYEWGITNLAFKLNEQLVSSHYLLETLMEYLRICGYTVTPYKEKATWHEQDGTGERYVPEFDDVTDLMDYEYKELERAPHLITEPQRWQIAKYEVEHLFPGLRDYAMAYTPRVLANGGEINDVFNFWKFFSRPSCRYNLITEVTSNFSELKERIRGDERVQNMFAPFVDLNLVQKKAIHELCDLFGIRRSFEIKYSSADVKERENALESFVNKHRKLFGIRTCQGKNKTTYLTAAVKKIFSDWLTAPLERTRVFYKGKQSYIYSPAEHVTHVFRLAEQLTHTEVEIDA